MNSVIQKYVEHYKDKPPSASWVSQKSPFLSDVLDLIGDNRPSFVAVITGSSGRTPFAGLVGPLRSPMSGSDCLIVETNWVFNGIAVAITVHESGQWGWATLDGENDKRLVQESPIPLDHYATLGELLAVLAVAFERRNAP